MKLKNLFLVFSFIMSAGLLFSQAPLKFNYQAVARDNGGNVLASQPVGIQISIRQTTPLGIIVYSETHATTTTSIGLMNLSLGGGTVTAGNFSTIDWGAGPYYIELGMDASGGTSYITMGTQQLLSVPYALYSANGTPGPAGPMGPQGPIGLTGPAGPMGPQGSTGADGLVGPQGIQGPIGPIGLTGADGAQGIQGIQGPTGLTGADGLVGPQGPIGLTGADGTQGIQGIQGPNGLTGPNGPVGPQGIQGPIGITGTAGPIGPQGPIGLTGPAGPSGPAGLLTPGIAAGNTPYWDGSAWVTGNSNIYNNGDYVGIGTNNPSHKLHVFSDGVRFERSGQSLYFNPNFGLLNTHAMISTGVASGPTTNDLRLQAGNDNSTNGITIKSNGNIGIGTTNPSQILHVVGDEEIFERSGKIIYFNANYVLGNTHAVISTGTNANPTTMDLRLIAGSDNTNGICIKSSGNVGIGTNTPSALLSVNGTADKPGGGSWAVFSDQQLKKDISPFVDGLSVLEKINPVWFNYNGKGGISTTERYVGIIAQEMQKIAPYTVKTVKMKLHANDDLESDILSFDPSALDFILINSVKDLQILIEQQELEIKKLKLEIIKLKQ